MPQTTISVGMQPEQVLSWPAVAAVSAAMHSVQADCGFVPFGWPGAKKLDAILQVFYMRITGALHDCSRHVQQSCTL